MTTTALDHVHLEVADRERSAQWYARVLGLDRHYDYREHGDAHGPLMLSGDGGRTCIAVFEDAGAAQREHRHNQSIAFRFDGKRFVEFLAQLADIGLTIGLTRGGKPVVSTQVVDHGNSLSLYFDDPDGNPIEVTTYDVDAARSSMKRN